MVPKQANTRLSKEYKALATSPPPFVVARPYESNLLECHFIMRGPPDSPYVDGEYHGVLLFPPQYPFAPPGIKVFTPSGRFQPDRKICTSFSDFHAGSWNPAWSVATILTGLLSFMLSDEITTGSIRGTDAEKKAFAASSHAWNLKNPKFKAIFPEYAGPTLRRLPNMGEGDLGKPDNPSEPALPANLGNPAGPSSSGSTSVAGMTDSMAKTTLQSGSSAASEGTRAAAARASSSRRTIIMGLGALIAAALVMRMLGS